MSYEFKRLADVPAVEELTDQDHLLAEVGGEVVRVPRGEIGGGAFVVDLMGMEVLKVNWDYDDTVALKAPDEAAFSGLWKAVLDGRLIRLRNCSEFVDTNNPGPVDLDVEEAPKPGRIADNVFVSAAFANTVNSGGTNGTLESGGALIEVIALCEFYYNATYLIYPADYVSPDPQ